MNLIPLIAEKLGVKVGEVFRVKDKSGVFQYDNLYKFEKDRLVTAENNRDVLLNWGMSHIIDAIVCDWVEIIKLPFSPKEGDTYWFVKFADDIEPCIGHLTWHGYTIDYLNKYCENCFCTEKEAEREKYNVAEKLTGKKWKP